MAVQDKGEPKPEFGTDVQLTLLVTVSTTSSLELEWI